MTNELQPIENGDQYLPEKPKERRRQEETIRRSLIEQGHPRELADAVRGYTPEDVPFIYRAEPHDVKHSRTRDNWTEGYELIPGKSTIWVGTSDAIHNLGGEWNDQIPEVLVQWRGTYIEESEQQEETTKVTRTEVHHLSDGSFVELEYGGVSNMGEFDGYLSQISLNVPEGTFRPGGGKERNSYRIFYFHRHRKDSAIDDVPGGVLVRKDAETHEWTLDLSHSNVSGTTILNGFSELIGFYMGEIEPVKEDWERAFRFTPLPEKDMPTLLPSSAEEQYRMILSEETEIDSNRIIELESEVRELMQYLTPVVLEDLTRGKNIHDAIQMQIDGILNYADKIWVFNKNLAQFSREQRFYLAQKLAKVVKQGGFVEWVQTLQQSENTRFINDVVNRNIQNLLAWFKQNASTDTDLREWVAWAREGVEITLRGVDAREKTMILKAKGAPASIAGKNPFHIHQYQQVYNGMLLCFVERFVEYLAQQYFGNSLM